MDQAGAGSAASGTPAGSGDFVGRDRELAELVQGLDEAVAGHSRIFLLTGEAGIGKSRLADEIARVARHRDVLVLWGRCWEAGGAPAYWPWVQVLRSCLREVDRQADPQLAEVDRVVQELAELRADAPASGHEAESARFWQFDAVTRFLTELARRRPALLVLDDLHAADAPSLLLLRFLAKQLADAPLVVIGTLRPEDTVPGTPLTEAIAELRRSPTARGLDLTGLDVEQVARMVESVTGVQPSDAVAAALLHETGGNPFFVSEISRLAAAEGGLDEVDPAYWSRTIPQGVRQVVRLRVDRLSRECARVLSLAAVLGREFGVPQLSHLSGLDVDDLDEVLDEAADAGLLASGPPAGTTKRFSHAVIRDTLYDELPASHRARLHVQAGEILEASAGDARAAEVAHHFFHAGPRAGVDRTIAAARRAGDHSLALLAYEEAARLYRMAITTCAWADSPDLRTECELHLSLGDASSRAGDHDETRRSFLRAAELADGLEDPSSFARAALGYGGRFVWLRASADPRLLPLLERALEGLGGDEPELRVRVMARVAGAKRDEVDRGPRDALSAETVALARQIGDDGLLAYALTGRLAALLGPAHAPGQESPEELLEVATRAGDAELRFEGHMHEMLRALERGDPDATTRVCRELARIAGLLHQPTHDWFAIAAQASVGLLQGRLDEAEPLIARAVAVGLQAQYWDAQGFGDVQWFILRREQGRSEELRDRVDASLLKYPTRPLFACMAAALSVELDDAPAAQAILDELAGDGFHSIPLNNDWSLSTFLLAEVVHGLDDADRAASLYEVMRPAAGRCVETVEASVGAMDHALGLLAATAHRWDDAIDHLERALATNRRIGAPTWAAHTRLALAAALRARGVGDDVARAAAEVDRARVTSKDRRLRRLEDLVERASAGPQLPATVHAGRDGPRRAVFHREGDLWVVGFAGAEHRIQGAKGLGHIATLLAAPGTQIHVLDLAGGMGAEARGRDRHGADVEPGRRGGGAHDVLDARARAEYRERIEALQAELDEAEAWNDTGRAAKATEELDLLVTELTAASGLGVRSRSFATDAERARVNVRRSIQAAITKIGACDPDLAWHLDRSLHTGMFCSYEPDRESPIDWQLSGR